MYINILYVNIYARHYTYTPELVSYYVHSNCKHDEAFHTASYLPATQLGHGTRCHAPVYYSLTAAVSSARTRKAGVDNYGDSVTSVADVCACGGGEKAWRSAEAVTQPLHGATLCGATTARRDAVWCDHCTAQQLHCTAT